MKLDGIRVLDLSRFLPGPWIGLTMADHGAEVIKTESFEGEPTRHLGPTDQLLERLGYDAAARAKLHAAKVC